MARIGASKPAEVSRMSARSQTVVPMISYEDGVAALDWLVNAFGFRERTRLCDPTGRLMMASWRSATN